MVRISVKGLTIVAVIGGLLLGPGTEALAAGSNLVTNPQFADGTTGWNVGPGDTLAVVPGGHDTLNAGEVSNGEKTAEPCLLSDHPDTVPSAEAGTYSSSIWVEGPHGAVIFSMKEHNPGHTAVVGEAKARLILSGIGTWQRVSLTYTVMTPGDTLGISVVEGSAPPGECFLADDAFVKFGSSS